MQTRLVAAFGAGLLFAVGLAVGGMTLPSKVIGFLDMFGNWDPSLAFVMAGAVTVNFVLSRLLLRRPAPLLASRFLLPTRTDIDTSLMVGSALFGIGWGLGGYCPGPAVVGLGQPGSGTLLFVAAMLAGMFLHRIWSRHRARRVEAPAWSGTPGELSKPDPR